MRKNKKCIACGTTIGEITGSFRLKDVDFKQYGDIYIPVKTWIKGYLCRECTSKLFNMIKENNR